MNVNNNNKENLISIDEVIKRAKKLGVAFGDGDPKNRLRYYVKIGLIPHAKRKVLKNNFPEGAYPKEIVRKLYEIDKKIRAGKSIQQIRREIESEREGIEEKGTEKKEIRLRYILTAPKIFFVVLLSVVVFYFLYSFNAFNAINAMKLNFENLTSSFLANLSMKKIRDFAQSSAIPTKPLEKESFKFSEIGPYLTINAETAINGKLNVRDSISASSFAIANESFKANLTAGFLSVDRTYTFPDQSGIVCLSSGNCVGLGGEVVSSGATTNRLAKFIAPNKIGNSSIADTYEGVAITISPTGNVGIGTNSPKGKLDVNGEILTKDLSVANNAKIGKNLFVANNLGIGEENSKYPLYVKGKIQAAGDICTDLKGGKCLSQLSAAAAPVFFGGGGIGGSGTANYLALWQNSGSLTNSIVSQSGSTLTVAGTIKITGFQLTSGAHQGYILTSDSSGIGTWQPAPTGTLPVGLTGQTLRYDGTSWAANSFLYNTGSAIGIGTTSTLATLTLAGNSYFQGPLTIATSTPQLILKYDDTKTFGISVSSTGAVILDSSSGKIQLGPGDTLYTEGGNPIREKGEEVVRAVVPIFRYDLPSQTASTSFVRVSKYISDNLELSLPSSFDGTSRVYHLIIKYADDISTSSTSSWQVVNSSHTTTTDSFTLPGRGMSNLEEGIPYVTGAISIPDSDWQIEVKVPSGKKIRIFNIFLLATDKIE